MKKEKEQIDDEGKKEGGTATSQSSPEGFFAGGPKRKAPPWGALKPWDEALDTLPERLDEADDEDDGGR